MTPREATERIGGIWKDGRGIGPCPVPGHGKGRGDLNWSLSIGSGVETNLLVHCYAGCDPLDVLAAIRNQHLTTPPPAAGTAGAAVAGTPTRQNVINLWQRGQPIERTLAATYLASRRLAASSEALRFVPNAWHSPTKRYLPAMLAALEDKRGDIIAVQRTFLSASGSKASVQPDRMILGRLKTAAVRLTPAAQTLGLAEGVETALAASQLFRVPCWAACGSRLQCIFLPHSVRRVMLFADNDVPGIKTAARAQRRFEAEGRKVEVQAPAARGLDWNDILTDRGEA